MEGSSEFGIEEERPKPPSFHSGPAGQTSFRSTPWVMGDHVGGSMLSSFLWEISQGQVMVKEMGPEDHMMSYYYFLQGNANTLKLFSHLSPYRRTIFTLDQGYISLSQINMLGINGGEKSSYKLWSPSKQGKWWKLNNSNIPGWGLTIEAINS